MQTAWTISNLTANGLNLYLGLYVDVIVGLRLHLEIIMDKMNDSQLAGSGAKAERFPLKRSRSLKNAIKNKTL